MLRVSFYSTAYINGAEDRHHDSRNTESTCWSQVNKTYLVIIIMFPQLAFRIYESYLSDFTGYFRDCGIKMGSYGHPSSVCARKLRDWDRSINPRLSRYSRCLYEPEQIRIPSAKPSSDRSPLALSSHDRSPAWAGRSPHCDRHSRHPVVPLLATGWRCYRKDIPSRNRARIALEASTHIVNREISFYCWFSQSYDAETYSRVGSFTCIKKTGQKTQEDYKD